MCKCGDGMSKVDCSEDTAGDNGNSNADSVLILPSCILALLINILVSQWAGCYFITNGLMD